MQFFSPRVHLYTLEHHPACDLSIWLLEELFLCLSRQANCYLHQTLPGHSTLQLLSGTPANVLSQGIAYFFTPINVFASGSGVSAWGAPSALAYLPSPRGQCGANTGSCHRSCPLPASGLSSLPRVPGKSTTNLPFCVVLGKLARSTQSAASPELNEGSGIWDLFVSYCPARQCWASPLGACAILPPICERGLALLTSLVKGFSYMDKSWALEVFVTRSFETTALPSPTLQAVLLSQPKALLQDVVGTGCAESRGVFLLQGGITWSRSWWMCKMLWPSQIRSALFVLECRMGSWSSWAPLGS